MKTTLTFNLPDEREEYLLAFNGPSLHSVLWGFDQWLRGEIKYNNNLQDLEYKTFEQIRKKLWEMINEHGVDL